MIVMSSRLASRPASLFLNCDLLFSFFYPYDFFLFSSLNFKKWPSSLFGFIESAVSHIQWILEYWFKTSLLSVPLPLTFLPYSCTVSVHCYEPPNLPEACEEYWATHKLRHRPLRFGGHQPFQSDDQVNFFLLSFHFHFLFDYRKKKKHFQEEKTDIY